MIQRFWPWLVLILLLGANLTALLIPYGGNPSALLHTDELMQSLHPLPPGIAVLQIPAYDGAQYYQVARFLPLVFDPDRWPILASFSTPGPNAYQRFLLPLTAWIITLGHDQWLPIAFLLINVASIVATFWMVLRWRKNALPAFALALCPAALIGLHFSLAEPLTIALITAFLIRCVGSGKVTMIDVFLLCLIGIAREINLLFLIGMFAIALWRQQWKDAILLSIPLITFALLQFLIYGIFGSVPLFLSTAKHALPLQAIGEILLGHKGYGIFTLSSIALFLLFVLPATAAAARSLIKDRRDPVTILLAGFLLVMLLMPDIIWGSITSIGRVITPVYPLFVAHDALHQSALTRAVLVAMLLLGLGSAAGLAGIVHPFVLS